MVAFGKKLKERQIPEWQREEKQILLAIFYTLSAYPVMPSKHYLIYSYYIIKLSNVPFVNFSGGMVTHLVHFSYYINYKLMKKKVKHYAHQIEIGALDRRHVLKDFSRMLDNQVFRCFELQFLKTHHSWLFGLSNIVPMIVIVV
ncbi:hypothetical protein POM88_040462 [Heracleum sosnowskyi]|uniref:Uncharacterized protein n=1 Tax=Heracleum sosnowskyi TaxID=360622 RepID=A0AAD8HE61_9APIA|nr:hypothetical protein POM88_040462 [Heracleum sosnowskyi]